jgi:hypothetical protein
MGILLLPGDPGFSEVLQSQLPASDIPLANRNYIANDSGILEAASSKQFLEYAYDSYAGWDTDEDTDSEDLDDDWDSPEEMAEYLWELRQDLNDRLSMGKT